MRLDKYLKVARILKRRTVAKELADQKRIRLNDRIGKASSEVNIGDVVCVQFGNRELTIKVLDTPKQVNKNDATLMFEVLDEIRIEKEPLAM